MDRIGSIWLGRIFNRGDGNMNKDREYYEKILMNFLVDEIKSNPDNNNNMWGLRALNFLVSVLSNNNLPNDFKLTTLIKHNIDYPSKYLNQYLSNLPGMRQEHLNGAKELDQLIEQNHGFIAMQLYNDDAKQHIFEKPSGYAFLYDNFEISIKIHLNDSAEIIVEIGNIGFNITQTRQALKNIKLFMEYYEELKDNSEADNMTLLDILII